MLKKINKREPVRVNAPSANYSKHFNQMEFKGIVQNDNFLDVDQQSLKNAKNIYVDEDNVLTSRLPINNQPISDVIVPAGFYLVDIFTTGTVIVYICQNDNKEHRIVSMMNGSIKVLPALVTKYHISAIEKYIIVFNNVDAMVLDINNYSIGWKPLRDFAEIPIVKRMIGQEVYTTPKNQFTESIKEEYVWSDEVIYSLPNGTAEVTVNQTPQSLVWTIENANMNTEFRILRSSGIKIQPSDILSIGHNEETNVTVICIARTDHVLISLNDAQSFERVLYPIHDDFLNIASISKDGKTFFFVASDAVYWYSVTDKYWEYHKRADDLPIIGIGHYNTCCFNNQHTFSFVLYYEDNGIKYADIYWKGQGLKTEDSPAETMGVTTVDACDPESQMTRARMDCASSSIFVDVIDSKTIIAAWLPHGLSPYSMFVGIVGQGDDSNAATIIRELLIPYGKIKSIISATTTDIKFDGLTVRGELWCEVTMTISSESDVFNSVVSTTIEVDDTAAPFDLETAYLVDNSIYSMDGLSTLPNQLNGNAITIPRRFTMTYRRNFYIVIDDTLYTNKMLLTSNAVLTYTMLSDERYTQIPDVSHVNNELYLGFGNTLKITSNDRDGTDLKFNLPAINNHSFTSSVNGMINISTQQVAIFLANQIFLVVQVNDELLGYRYDYYNTRLSTGIRSGDSVINTRDGAYTLFPTSQGLAFMNYQQNVAATDQVIDYVTKNINKIWRDFYKASTTIKLIQMNDFIFITNGTKDYLMLDLRGVIWWVFDSPVPIMKMIIDQAGLSIISNGLYIFDNHTINYRDLMTKDIDWYIESQPLHFKMPNHYKNIRQLIFQFKETTENEQTIVVQIKLYRKQITIREPDVVNFAVDGYRTFIKRFNYCKINELQWALSADFETEVPSQLKLNGITIKYERGDEVRS